MNLINDAWLPVIREDGTRELVAPWQIAETSNPICELDAARADFQGALYQLLIGLLQTAIAPDDTENWFDYYEGGYPVAELKQRLSALSGAFELFSEVNQPAFMQDLTLAEGEEKSIAGLLIDAPGGKTIRDNLDFFVKGGRVNVVCPSCAAQALFTLQTNAPSGGVGHRVGLRGGGPLTTLLRPEDSATLWQKLWLNVLTVNAFEHDEEDVMSAAVFPWLGATRLSDKTGQSTYATDVSPLQMYWGMPRRMRLVMENTSCTCDLCGMTAESCVRAYTTKNYGTNYDGAWLHPLTPYRFDLKKPENPQLSLKGQQGGLSYKQWLGLLMQDQDNGDRAAKVVSDFLANKIQQMPSQTLQLWCFGYDMDNMKARCWYEQMMPVLQLNPNSAAKLQGYLQQVTDAARQTAQLLRSYVKQAWYRHPKGVGGDMSYIDAEFYQQTTQAFYQLLTGMATAVTDNDEPPRTLLASWQKTLLSSLTRHFDRLTLSATPEALDLKRVMHARAELLKKFRTNKIIKSLQAQKVAQQETTNG